jgi:ABC-type nitrate/sulfonate/bicarbonate transport system substrate-binding protein
MREIKIGIGTSSIGRFLPYVGAAAGLFERQGIAADIVNQFDEEKVVEDIVTQEAPIGTPNAPSLLFSLLNGNDLVIVGGLLNRPAFYLVANEKVSSPDGLRGKKVGINQPRRMAGMMMLVLLRRWRIDPARDLELVDLGLNDRSFEALQSGALDAALLPPEKAFLAEASGLRVIADSLALDCQWVPLATTRRFLAAERELVRQVALIYRDSIHIFKNDERLALEAISRQLPVLRSKPEALQKCYRVFAELFEPALALPPNSLSAVLAEVALQDVRANSVNPPSLVEELI